MSILVNGSPTETFKMEKGVKARDPLSPFLFVLVADMLNKRIIRAISMGIIKGIMIRKNKVSLAYLQFVDGTIIFCLTKEKILMNYRRIL